MPDYAHSGSRRGAEGGGQVPLDQAKTGDSSSSASDILLRFAAPESSTMLRYFAPMLALAALVMILGCGQTGDLYLPEPTEETEQKKP
jgi:hypothetical protein